MTDREAFEKWFFASKYAQVVLPSSGDVQRGLDAWQAACEWQRERDAEICVSLIPDIPISENDFAVAILNQGKGEGHA